jgi:Squalene-hopene cyclase C-terminal domain
VLASVVDNLRRVRWRARRHWQAPPAAHAERRRDRTGPSPHDPGAERVIAEGIGWLGRAQDHSLSQDGGVARHYSLETGWSASYPETTGYIIPTMLAYSESHRDQDSRRRARRMLEWLVSIQLPDGAFQGGMIDERPIVPVTFDTGQILIGLAAGVREFGECFRDSLLRAGDWLVSSQDPDGCWRRYAANSFTVAGEKTYETHVAWGLLEAERIAPGRRYAEAALANVRWALSRQRSNGWFENCCLEDHDRPLTHTIGYALRGLLEAYRFTREAHILQAARQTADGLLTALGRDGWLPGRLNSEWTGVVRWCCLTGTSQIAYSWLLLYRETGDPRYREAAFAANRYVRCTMDVDGPPQTRGAIKGSFPVDGDYGTYQYLNWAVKFCIDANLCELAIRGE